MADPNDTRSDELTTITLTVRERVRIAHALTMAAAMVDALGDDARGLLELWARIQPDMPEDEL